MSDSTETLRRAAALMRERAELMAPPPWEVSYINPAICATRIDQWFVMSDPHGVNVGPLSIHEWEPTAHYVASWHPAVALAVADWLDHEANVHEASIRNAAPADHRLSTHALAVARTYLGESA